MSGDKPPKFKGIRFAVNSREPDLRIKRLAVSIMKTNDLLYYLFDDTKLTYVCLYVDIEKPSLFRNVNDVITFLDSLYYYRPEKFQQFFDKVLNEIREEHLPLAFGKNGNLVDGKELFRGFDLFNRELNTLGFNYDVHNGKLILTVGHIREEIKIGTEIEEMLNRLNPEYQKMLQGAWDAFLSDSSDKYRQTAISIRELINKVINQLAPINGERREKVKQILGSECEAELVDAVANTVVKLYGLQSKVHYKLDYENTLFALKTTEYLLYFLLKKQKN